MKVLIRTTALVVVTLVLGTAGCSNSSTDAAITTRVKHAISKEPALKATNVSVSTEKRVVHLGGTVKSRDERALLIAVARKVDGVQAVKTDLAVTPPQKPKVQARAKQTKQTKQKPRTQQRVSQRQPEFAGTGR